MAILPLFDTITFRSLSIPPPSPAASLPLSMNQAPIIYAQSSSSSSSNLSSKLQSLLTLPSSTSSVVNGGVTSTSWPSPSRGLSPFLLHALPSVSSDQSSTLNENHAITGIWWRYLCASLTERRLFGLSLMMAMCYYRHPGPYLRPFKLSNIPPDERYTVTSIPCACAIDINGGDVCYE
jgi:hypothetical protein